MTKEFNTPVVEQATKAETIIKETHKTETHKGNKIVLFEHKDFGKVRTLSLDNEPWFVGKDVAEALGYRNTKDA